MTESPSGRPSRILWGCSAIVLVALGSALVLNIAFEIGAPLATRYRTVHQMCQPETQVDAQVGRYCVTILERNEPGERKTYLIFVAGDWEEVPGYGHYLEYPYPSGSIYLDDGLIRLTDAVWSADGVRLTLIAGHELFIPAESYSGGR